MKKKKIKSLALKKHVISSLNGEITGGNDKDFTVTCAIPVSNCTVALTVQPKVCESLPRPLGNCTVALSVQVWCNTLDKNC